MRQLTPEEFKASQSAFAGCAIEGNSAVGDRLLFRAGFAAGLEYHQSELAALRQHVTDLHRRSIDQQKEIGRLLDVINGFTAGGPYKPEHPEPKPPEYRSGEARPEEML